MAMAMGGYVRFRLEDNICYSKGIFAKSNAQLVERVVQMAKGFEKEIATPKRPEKF